LTRKRKSVWTNTEVSENLPTGVIIFDCRIDCIKGIFVKVRASHKVTEIEESAECLNDLGRYKPLDGRKIDLNANNSIVNTEGTKKE